MVKRLYSMALLCLAVLTASAQNAVQVVADPADGSTVETLSSVTLTFEGLSVVDKGSKANDVTITSTAGYSAGCTLDYGTADNQMAVSFTEVSAEATYTITFPENAFSSDEATIPAFTLTYQIGAAQQTGLIVTPASGNTVTWLTDIVVAAADAPGKSLSTPWNAEEKPRLLNPSGEELTFDGNSVWDSETGTYSYHIQPRLLITTPGEYKLVIPDDYFYYYDDTYNQVLLPGLTATYNVTVGETEPFVSQPSKDEPVSKFKDLVIAFPGVSTVASNSTQNIVLYQDGETWKGSASLSYNWTFAANTMSFSVYSEIIDAGHYTMTFPEGCILLDSRPNAPFMVEFDIVENEPLNLTITPGEGDAVTGILNGAVITVNTDAEFTYNAGSVSLYRIDDDKEINIGSAYGTATTVQQEDGKTFVVTFNGMATESGTYKITVPKNLFSTADRFNAETNVTFTYTAPEAPTMVVEPADGTELDRVQNFTITFPEVEEDVTVNTGLSIQGIILYKGIPYYSEYGYLVGTTHSTVALANIVKTEGKTNEFTISFSNPGIEAGEYALAIPAGIFLVGDKTFNATDTLVYTATGNGLDKIEATPAEPVASLKDITLTYVNETSVTFQNSYASITLYKVDPDNTWDTYKEAVYAYESDWGGYCYIDEATPNTVNITLKNEYTEEGQYYFDVTGYFLYMSDGTTPSTVNRIYFTVDPLATSIKDANRETADRNHETYDLLGRKVSEMKKGLYITNGKKIVVK